MAVAENGVAVAPAMGVAPAAPFDDWNGKIWKRRFRKSAASAQPIACAPSPPFPASALSSRDSLKPALAHPPLPAPA